jgi:serine/threonine protein kinase
LLCRGIVTVTHLPSNRPAKAIARPSILGIWRIGQTLHESRFATLSLAQPADAICSPRWDYVIKRAVTGEHELEGRRQITQFIAAASCAAHPNLVAILDASATAASPYLVMPRLEGLTMQSHLGSDVLLPLPVALWWVRQVAQALNALHTAGWVHGDVKPENAIVGGQGHVTLVDLGFACRVHTVANHQFRGTPDYSAPESLSGEIAAMTAMDIFSLGRVLWQWMTRIEQVSRNMLEPVAELVEGMVAVNPADRPKAEAVAKQLLRLEIETLGRHIGPGRSRRAA